MPTALITGASSGIGTAFARLLVKDGYDVILVARRLDRLEALAAELNQGRANAAMAMPADLAKDGAPAELYDRVKAAGRQVDLLVNNAGLGKHGAFAELSHEDDRQMLDLNITALTDLTRAFLPAMVERKSGGVINVASTASFQSVPFMAVYAATKAYVLAFSEALAEEVSKHGVKVLCLCPGPTETEFTAVAEFKSDIFEKAPVMSAEAVAKDGIAAYNAGRAVHVAGLANQVGAVGTRFLPRAIVTKLAGQMFKPQAR